MKKLILICLCAFFLTGCVDKVAIKTKLDKAENMVGALTTAGFNTIDDQKLLEKANRWYQKYSVKQDFTMQEEQEINKLIRSIEQRWPLWETQVNRAYSKEVESYFVYNPNRKTYWKYVAMGALKAGMSKTEVKLIKGNPHQVGKAYSEDTLLDSWRYDQTTLWFQNDILQSWQ